MIADYLLELLGELRLAPAPRRRILAEVEDHLVCSAADLHAAGLQVADAEREAVRRFGPADQLACVFVEQQAALAGRRLARTAGLLAGVFAVLVCGSPGRLLPAGAFPGELLGFVLGQVALVAGGLTLVRAWRDAPVDGPRAGRLALVLRGAVVVVACAAGMVVYAIANVLASAVTGSGGWPLAGLLSLAALTLGLGITATALVRSSRLAAAARAAGRTIGRPSYDVTVERHPDAIADLQAIGVLALQHLGRRTPSLRGVTRKADWLLRSLPAELTQRAPCVAAWLDLRRHPWRFAFSIATTAGVALAVWHALIEGALSPADWPGALLGAAMLVSVEALAALMGFAVLGRYLGIRPSRSQS